MKDAARETAGDSQSRTVARRSGAVAIPARPLAVANALAFQRLAGNRVASRMLARWIRHPDPEKKGVMVADVVASELARFNPAKNE
jgi:hypothetical protein